MGWNDRGTYTDADHAADVRAWYRDYAQRREHDRSVLALTRRAGISGSAAARFLARQHASRQRHQRHAALQEAIATAPIHLLAHCGHYHPITTLPLTCPLCGAIYQEH